MNDHLFLSSDGTLYDTRVKPMRVIREGFSGHHCKINNSLQLRATLRAGACTLLGCYPLYFIADDGETLSFEAVREQFYQCAYSIRHDIKDGWRIVGCDANYEDVDMVCAHTGKPIESAYGE